MHNASHHLPWLLVRACVCVWHSNRESNRIESTKADSSILLTVVHMIMFLSTFYLQNKLFPSSFSLGESNIVSFFISAAMLDASILSLSKVH